jgi:hypothetical protein
MTPRMGGAQARRQGFVRAQWAGDFPAKINNSHQRLEIRFGAPGLIMLRSQRRGKPLDQHTGAPMKTLLTATAFAALLASPALARPLFIPFGASNVPEYGEYGEAPRFGYFAAGVHGANLNPRDPAYMSGNALNYEDRSYSIVEPRY